MQKIDYKLFIIQYLDNKCTNRFICGTNFCFCTSPWSRYSPWVELSKENGGKITNSHFLKFPRKKGKYFVNKMTTKIDGLSSAVCQLIQSLSWTGIFIYLFFYVIILVWNWRRFRLTHTTFHMTNITSNLLKIIKNRSTDIFFPPPPHLFFKSQKKFAFKGGSGWTASWHFGWHLSPIPFAPFTIACNFIKQLLRKLCK